MAELSVSNMLSHTAFEVGKSSEVRCSNDATISEVKTWHQHIISDRPLVGKPNLKVSKFRANRECEQSG